MGISLKLIKNLFYYAFGNLGSKIILFLLVPFYSFYLTKSELGNYDIILASVTVITPLLTLQVADSVYRHILNVVDQKKLNQFFSSGFFIVNISCFLSLIIFFFVNLFIDFSFIIELALIQAGYIYYNFVQQTIRGLGQHKIYAIMGGFNASMVLLFSVSAFVFFDFGFRGLLISIFMSNFLAAIIISVKCSLFKMLKLNCINFKVIKQMLLYSSPLLPNTLSWWVIDLGSRYLILFYLGLEENGIYAISARYAGIIAILNSIFILTWQDFVIKKKGTTHQNINFFSNIFETYIIFQFTLLIFLTSISSEIISYTTFEEFHSAKKYLPILLLSSIISSFCGFFGAFYLKFKNTTEIFVTTLYGSIINLLICFLFINEYNLYAVSIASVIGFLTTLLFRMRKYPIKVNYGLIFLLFLFFIIALYTVYTSSQNIFRISLICLSTILFVFLNIKSLFRLKKAFN